MKKTLFLLSLLMFTPAAWADVPGGYTQVTISEEGQLSTYTEADNMAFIIAADVVDGKYRMGGAHQYWTAEIPQTQALTFNWLQGSKYGGAHYVESELTLIDLKSLTYTGNSATDAGGAIYAPRSAATASDIAGTISLIGNETLSFAKNAAVYSGGAIFAGGELNVTDNQSVTFSDNRADSTISGGGGAIFGGKESSDITFNNNGSLSFTSNTAKGGYGGAVYANVAFTVTNHKSVIFSANYAEGSNSFGGAVYGSRNAVLTFSNNETMLFNGNYADDTTLCKGDGHGGAIATWKGELYITDNGSVTFSGNSSSYGAAISAEGVLNVARNKSVSFLHNDSVGPSVYSYGAAIYVSGTGEHSVSGNGSLEFVGNHALSLGGAILIAAGSNLSISNNGTIVFKENRSGGEGGAIYANGSLDLTGNGSVVFRGNYENPEAGSPHLRSVYMNGGALNMAAGAGQSITFYDTMYAGGAVSFNARYTDAAGKTQDAAGDIVFSGLWTESDLRVIFPGYFPADLTASRTSEVNSVTNLYGGRLRVEDGAIYQGRGIAVAAESNATLRLAGGSLQHAGYNITLAAGTTLEMQGVNNSISANTLDMQAGSTLSFVLESGNVSQAALSLNGTFNQGGALNIVLQAGETYQAGDKVILMSLSSGETPATWDSSRITLSGLATERNSLTWEDGKLLFYATLPELVTATWSGSQSRLWNNKDRNWVQGEYGYRNTDGADVKFTDTASGEVTLAGDLAPKSVLVANSDGHDYTFTGDGKLTGTMQLTKEGAGTLTINTANTYTGGTLLKGGTLVMGRDSALGSGDVTLAGGTLDLGSHTLDNKVSVTGDATLGRGMLNEAVSVADGKKLTLLEGTTIASGISLGEGASADLGGNKIAGTISLAGSATVGNGYLYSDLSVAEGKTLTLGGNLEGSGKIILADGAGLDMNHHSISNQMVLNGSATLGPGELTGDLSVADGKTLTLTGSLEGSGTIHLGNNTTLDMGGAGTSLAINVSGNATLSNGALDKAVTVQQGAKLTMGEKMYSFSGTKFTLADRSAADLGGNKLSGDFTLKGTAALTDGSLEVKSLDPAAQGLLQDMTVTPGLIEGFERPTSLADNLNIQSEADLLIKGMTITANNSISVGNHTITLNQVTIQLSQAEYKLLDGSYYFNLKSLINCDLKMDSVTFDASGLTLGSAMEKVVFDFGEDVNIDSATRMRLQLDEAWDGQAYITSPGLLVFSKSAPIPEPTTGTLGLLALAALAARKRRK